jgi:hypothetical protein
VAHTCNPSYLVEVRRIVVQGQSGQIVLEMPLPHLQNNRSKIHWRCGSSGRVPGLQALSRVQTLVPPKTNTQTKPKKNKTQPKIKTNTFTTYPLVTPTSLGSLKNSVDSGHLQPLISET